MTETGEVESQRLLRGFWWNYRSAIDPFMVAVSFLDRLPREELIGALRHHVAAARLAAINPLSHVVDAARALFNGQITDRVVGQGVAILAVLTILAMWWAARSFREATA